jgi:hypothetical protein
MLGSTLRLVIIGLFLISDVALAATTDDFFAGRVGILRDEFISTDINEQDSAFQGAYTRVNFLSGDDRLAVGGDLSGLYSYNSEFFNFVNPTELYLESSFGGSGALKLQVGRVKQDWSGIEDEWKLGFIEPVFRFDPLNRSNQGLTGVFVSFGSGKHRFTGFSSPVFVPSQGASLSVENGEVKSSSPWFQLPPENILLLGKVTPVQYELILPSTSEIAFQSTFYGKYTFEPIENQSFSVGLGYAPMNQLSLAVQGEYNVADQVAEVKIRPRVHMRDVAMVEYKGRFGNFDLNLATLRETPTALQLEEEWTEQIYFPLNVYHAQIGYNGRFLRTSLSYVQVETEDPVEIGPLATSNSSYLPSRLEFARAVRVRFQSYPTAIFTNWSLAGGVRLTREVITGGTHLRALLTTESTQGIGIHAGFDLLASADPDGEKSDIFSRYSRNDRFFTGVEYVF